MATFTPRTYDEILADMIAYVQATTELSDFNPGSIIRTILEAAALEDDEQYYQMVQLLDIFSYTTATGDYLDRRLQDFFLVREPAKTSTTKVRFYNLNIISSQVSLDAAAAASTVKVFSSGSFPNPSPSYKLRVGEGTTRVQDITVTALNYTTNTFTLSTPLLFPIYVGDRVTYIGTDSYSIPSGTSILAPATVSESSKTFMTQEPAYILAGNFYSNEVTAKSQSAGSASNVGVRRISQFAAAAPFPGAGVINVTDASGGRDRESDQDFRVRAVRRLQSLSRGTPLALTNAALSVTDNITGQRVVSANIVEDFVNDEVIVYIDDGTGFTPDYTVLTADSLASSSIIGAGTLTVNNVADFPSSGYILVVSAGTNTELLNYTKTDSVANTLTLASPATKVHTSGDIVLFVDYITDNTKSGQRRFRTQNFPLVRGTIRLFVNQGTTWQELLETQDFIVNKGTGEIQLVSVLGLAASSKVVAYYSYYTNLIAEVQRTLEGNLDNSVNYPGYKASGIFLAVEAPNLKRVTVKAVISAEDGFNESDLAPTVLSNIEAYINSRKIGEDVIRAKIVDVAFNVTGVKDVTIVVPTGNVTVLENELPVAFDSSGNSIVTVS
jgi:uncharacterized phage protein gp47/JayE